MGFRCYFNRVKGSGLVEQTNYGLTREPPDEGTDDVLRAVVARNAHRWVTPALHDYTMRSRC
jgi:hypothetical protein